jgi:hypothetical protein
MAPQDQSYGSPDNTAGRNNDNRTDLEKLDKGYANDPARQGTNAGKDNFDHGERK